LLGGEYSSMAGDSGNRIEDDGEHEDVCER
jgi:hypothetical protein